MFSGHFFSKKNGVQAGQVINARININKNVSKMDSAVGLLHTPS